MKANKNRKIVAAVIAGIVIIAAAAAWQMLSPKPYEKAVDDFIEGLNTRNETLLNDVLNYGDDAEAASRYLQDYQSYKIEYRILYSYRIKGDTLSDIYRLTGIKNCYAVVAETDWTESLKDQTWHDVGETTFYIGKADGKWTLLYIGSVDDPDEDE